MKIPEPVLSPGADRGDYGGVIEALAMSAALLAPSEDPAPPPAPPLSEVYAGQAKIRAGQAGPSVLTIQKQLTGVGKTAPSTGVFDAATLKAWNSYQAKFGWWETSAVSKNQAIYLKKLYGNGKLPKECNEPGLVICMDKTQLVLRQMRNGKQLAVADVRFGSERTPTRNGRFRIYHKQRFLISDLSNTPMPFSMFFSGGQAVHYSPGFHRDGYNGASLGCVNLASKKFSRALYNSTPLGTKVYVYRS